MTDEPYPEASDPQPDTSRTDASLVPNGAVVPSRPDPAPEGHNPGRVYSGISLTQRAALSRIQRQVQEFARITAPGAGTAQLVRYIAAQNSGANSAINAAMQAASSKSVAQIAFQDAARSIGMQSVAQTVFRSIDTKMLVNAATESQRRNRQIARQLALQSSPVQKAMNQLLRQHAVGPAATLGFESAVVRAQFRASDQIRTAALLAGLPSFHFDFSSALGDALNSWNTAHNLPQIFSRLAEHTSRLIPSNLRGLRLTEDGLGKVAKVNAADGTSLAWAPRQEIVEELIATEEGDVAARSAILVAHSALILDDVEESLAHITVEDHQALKEILAEVSAAARHGFWHVAQAGACNALETIVTFRISAQIRRSAWRTRTYFSTEPDKQWDDQSIVDLSLTLVGAGVATAFKNGWDPEVGSASFNRHGSAHHVDRGTHEPAHALRALLLAQAMLRWLDWSVAASRKRDMDAA